MPAGVVSSPALMSESATATPRPSMSIASREAKCTMFLSLCAGHSAPVQRMATPSSSRTMGEPHSGQVSGRWKGKAPSGRLLFTTSSTSGIISPALRTTTVSPMRTSSLSMKS